MIRIVVVNNSNQNSKAIFVADPTKDMYQQICAVAKNKLKIKKPSRIFLKTDIVTEIFKNDSLEPYLHFESITVHVSTGNEFIGKPVKITQAPITYLHQSAPVETEANKQLERTAQLPDMLQCVGMPDLHPGARYPIGAAFLVKDRVYPSLIGGDIGCGMTMYRLSINSKQVIGKVDLIASKIESLDGPCPNVKEWMAINGMESTEFDGSLGTVGRGNHFAEIQTIDKVWDEQVASEHGLVKEGAFLLVHSGSRGLGKQILEQYSSKEGLEGSEIQEYLQKHDFACHWARKNRELIANRVTECLGIQVTHKVLDIWHNHMESIEIDGNSAYLHRKGAAPTDKGLVAIPGSRGTLTYIVQAINEQQTNLFSVAHGAGRELSRSKALEKFKNQNRLDRNDFGGVVICEDSDLLCEEAPRAYKDIDIVIQDLVNQNLVKIIATMKPMVSYKMRK